MRINEKKDIILYIHYNIHYYIVYLEHHTMIDKLSKKRFYSHYNLLKLDKIQTHLTLVEILKNNRFYKVYTDLIKDTSLYKQLRKKCISRLKHDELTQRQDLIRDYQNLKGILTSDKVSITHDIRETLEKYSNLIDLESESFPPEIIALGKVSYLIKL